MNLTVRQKRNLMKSDRMMTVKEFRKTMKNDFEERYDALSSRTKESFDRDCAQAYFEREMLLDYLCYTVDRHFTPSKAFELIAGDNDTSDMVFEDAIEYAKHGCYL